MKRISLLILVLGTLCWTACERHSAEETRAAEEAGKHGKLAAATEENAKNVSGEDRSVAPAGSNPVDTKPARDPGLDNQSKEKPRFFDEK